MFQEPLAIAKEAPPLLIAILAFRYFLPWVVAYGRKAKHENAIGILNIFLGWTVLGWVGALVWEVGDNNDPARPRFQATRRDLPKVAPEKTSPRYAETVKAAALVCRFCGNEFQEPVLARR